MDILKKMYKKSMAYVKLDRKGETFGMEKGVKQGVQLSPNLFNAVLEEVFQKRNWGEKGITVGG